MRVRFTDVDLALNVAAGERRTATSSWSFGDERRVAAEARARDGLRESPTAILQGRESLAIAIARGQVRGPRRVAQRAALPAGDPAALRALPRVVDDRATRLSPQLELD